MYITSSNFSSPLSIFLLFFSSCWLVPSLAFSTTKPVEDYEILVHTGKVSDTIELFKSRDFWGPEVHHEDLNVPRIIIAVTSNRWEAESQNIEVAVKKELFYRGIVPMVLLANELIQKERQEIEVISEQMKSAGKIDANKQSRLTELAEKYGLNEITDPGELIPSLLKRVDVIPPSLALGQAAYESGYGTSRFAREGNALFGQWTYSGDGMKPEEHRATKGNYGVASFKWPFDSVRSYMFNLNTHQAYQALRDKRAVIRTQGKQPTGLELAETLDNYSEIGQEYVKTLKGIITENNLGIADQAYLRDEAITLTVGVPEESDSAKVESEIDQLRASGELDRIISEMNLN